MRKNIFLSMILVLFALVLQAQQLPGDVRTIHTKIADLMMQVPAENSADHQRIMNELSLLGDPAVANIAASLVPPGKGMDTPFRYALSGLVKYVAAGGDRTQMKQYSEALCAALKSVKDDEVRDFLLQELQYVAGDEAVAAVAPLLLHSRLADPAARVMVRINSGSSNIALLNALKKAPSANKVVMAQALGETRYSPAVRDLAKLARSSDVNLKTTAMRSLAMIGAASSSNLLSTAAKKAGYAYEPTDATGSFLFYLKSLAVNGNQALADKMSRELVFDESIPVATRSAALRIISLSSGDKAAEMLMKALDSPDKEFRAAALTQLGSMFTAKTAQDLRSRLQASSNPEHQSEIISLLADKKDKQSIPVFVKSLNSSDKSLQLAAIQALAKMGHKESISPIIELMGTADIMTLEACKEALLRLEGEPVADVAAEYLPKTSGKARVALIEIIAARKAERHSKLIFAQAQNPDTAISFAAVSALSALVTPVDTIMVANLLNKVGSPREIALLQESFYTAIHNLESKSMQVAVVNRFMSKPGAEQTRFYNLLARIGGTEALAVVENRLSNGTPAQKVAAMSALTAWSDDSVLPVLLGIGANHPDPAQRASALGSYISGINRSANPQDQKVLMFRKAMELTATQQQKRTVISQVAANPTLLALIFVSKYLDNPDTQQAAVQAVRAIVMGNPALYGSAVNEIVTKAIKLNQNAEAEYQREELMKHMAKLPKEDGFISMFNGTDLTGWKGLVENPIARSKMTPAKLAEEQQKANERMRRDWRVENGVLIFEGEGYDNLCSEKMYGDFELVLDWKMEPKGDGGVYLRGSPQVQTWDTSRVEVGAQVGSGGLYNNKVHRSKPLLVADNPINDWNTFRITMIGDKVTVYLNGLLVTDNVVLENYWDRSIPIFEKESIELQAHGTRLDFRDVYVREIPRPEPYVLPKAEQEEGFVPMFNGVDLTGWTGNMVDYFAQEGMIVCQPSGQGSGNLFTSREYSDFIMRFEFQLTPGANNGLGIRTPLTGDAAYVGMELQILDNEAPIYSKLQPYQYHGSIYGVIPAKRGFLKPTGEWNYQEVKASGNRITITLNGEVILDGDIAEASKNGTETIDKRPHPGLLNKSGHIGFLGHGSPLKFRNLRIKDLSSK
jgi:HEAT repeat protein